MTEDPEARSGRLKDRIDAEVKVLSDVARPFELEVVNDCYADGLVGDPESPAYHAGVGRNRRYTLVGPGSERGEIKILGWDKRRPGTEAELQKHFLNQLHKYQARIRRARVDKLTESYDSALIEKHRGLIDKFMEIAERTVAVVDDYGDESWEALGEEIARCALKIAKVEGDRGGQKVRGIWTWFPYRLRLNTWRDRRSDSR